MSTPSRLMRMLARLTSRPKPLSRGWLAVTAMVLPKEGFRVALLEFVANRLTLEVALKVAPEETRVLAPTVVVVESVRGPALVVPSSLVVEDADWFKLRRIE